MLLVSFDLFFAVWLSAKMMSITGNPELEEKFKNLKRLQVEYGSVSSNQDKDEEEVRKLREENARSEGEVKSFREREKLKCTVKTMEKKKAWMVYQEEAKQYEQRNKAAEELQQEYDRAAARFKPLEKKISQQDNLITRTKEALRNKVGLHISMEDTKLIGSFICTAWGLHSGSD